MVVKVFRGTGGSRRLVVLSLAVLSLVLMPPAARVQTVINFLIGFTVATAHITLQNPLAGGSSYLNPSQCGWTF